MEKVAKVAKAEDVKIMSCNRECDYIDNSTILCPECSGL
jgi:hypothetical protein